jgi:glycosidase
MIYYGDEVGLRGENDPGCRGTMPWDEARWRTGILEAVREATALRAREAVLRRGAQRVVALAPDVVAIVRFDTDRALATIVNRASAPVPIDTGALDEALGGVATIGGRWTGADAASRVIVPAAGTVVSVKGEAE